MADPSDLDPPSREEGFNPRDLTSIETVSGFDLQDLKDIVATVYGTRDDSGEMVPDENAGERIVNNAITDLAGQLEGVTKESIISGDGSSEYFGDIVGETLIHVYANGESGGGPRAAQQIQNRIANLSKGEEFADERAEIERLEEEYELKPRRDPTSNEEAFAHVDGFLDYLNDSFNSDRLMRFVFRRGFELMDESFETNKEASGIFGDVYSGLDADTFLFHVKAAMFSMTAEGAAADATAEEETRRTALGVGLRRHRHDLVNPQGSAMRAPFMDTPSGRATRSVLSEEIPPEFTEEEVEDNFALLENFLHEYETGRSDLPWDHRLRDQSGILKAIEEGNGSPRVDDLMENARISTRTVRFLDPAVALGTERMTAEDLDEVAELRNSRTFRNMGPAEQAKQLAAKAQQMSNRASNYLWETSNQLGGAIGPDGEPEFDPEDTVYTREFFTKEYSDEIKDVIQETYLNPSAYPGLQAQFIDTSNAMRLKLERAMAPQLDLQNELTMGDLQRYYLEMPDKNFREMQLAALQAGAYDQPNSPYQGADEIPWGSRGDEVARVHWDSAVARSRRQNLLGEKITVDAILDAATERGINRDLQTIEDLRDSADNLRALAQRAPNLASILISTPETIISQADALAQRELGRNATPEERRLLIKMVRTQQQINGTAKARQAAAVQNRELTTQAELQDIRGDRAETAQGFSDRRDQILSENTSAEAERNFEGTVDQNLIDPGVERRNRLLAELQAEEDAALAQQGIETGGGGIDGGNTTGGGSDVQVTTFEDFDQKAFMQNYLKQNNAPEVREHAVRQGFNTFMRALKSPISQ